MYFEIFCNEQRDLSIGKYTEDIGFVIVAHGLINNNLRQNYLNMRKKRINELADKLNWLRIYHNNYAPDEFVVFCGFANEKEFNDIRRVDELLLEEYLFTGLTNPLEMSQLAEYNQYICSPLLITDNLKK